jgi:drug/metabolite transporter (DMT)-like permease
MSVHAVKSTTTIGILCALIAGISFSLNDLGIKFLSGDYPLHQIVLTRASVGILFTLAIFIPMEGGYHNLKTKRLGLHFLRGLFVVLANMSFFLGLAALPLSEATAIFFVSPLVITLFSVIFLGERVGPWRWFAVASGLLGAFIMLRPGTSAFQYAALFPLGGAVGYAALHILTRKMGVTESASTMAFYIQLTFIFVSAFIGLLFGDGKYAGGSDPSVQFLLREWVWPQTSDLAIMAGVGVASAVGGYMISQAYRTTEAAIIAPFEYIALIMAIVWGITVFGEWPDAVSWLGILLILGAGLLVFWRESVLKKRIAAERPMPRQR